MRNRSNGEQHESEGKDQSSRSSGPTGPFLHIICIYNIYTLVNLKLSGEKQFLNINQLNGGIVAICSCRYLCMVAICRQGQPCIDKQYESNHIELQVENGGRSRVSNLKVMQIGLWPWPNENATRFAACESCDTRPEWQNNCVRRVYNLQRATKIKV